MVKTKQIKEALNVSNIKFLEATFPNAPSHRYHFDMFELSKQFNFKDYSADVVLTNMPELATNLKHFLMNTQISSKIFGFSHWDDNY